MSVKSFPKPKASSFVVIFMEILSNSPINVVYNME